MSSNLNITFNNATYDTTTQKVGTAAMVGGYGVTSGYPSWNTSPSWTIEGWFKIASNPANNAYIAGQFQFLGLRVTTTGLLQGGYGGSPGYGSVQLASPSSVADGNWHHAALVVTATGGTLYLDGVSVATSTVVPGTVTGGAGVVTNTSVWGVGCAGSGTTFGASTNSSLMEVDEVAGWNYAKYTANFTPSTTPYTGNETNQVLLYHLDSNGNNSTAANIILPNNSAIIYSPYNWLVSSASAIASNSGAYFKMRFTGNLCTLLFNMSNITGAAPSLRYRMDGVGSWTDVTCASTVNLVLNPATSSTINKHMLEVIVNALDFTDRWNQHSSPVLTGIQIGGGATADAPRIQSKYVLEMGDSITEGQRDENTGNQVDASGGWAYMQTEQLGAEVGVVGFGGQGLTVASGTVPAFPSALGYLFNGVPRNFTSPAPDLIVINQGTNDATAPQPDSAVQAAMTTALNSLLAATPSTTKIAVLQNYRQNYVTAIQAAIAAVNNSRITYIPTAGWFDTTNSVDGVHPNTVENRSNLSILVGNALRPLLYGSGTSKGRTFIYS